MASPPPPEPDAASASNRAARRRRRSLYGPPPRLSVTSALAGRLLWHIGDWGRASEHIGNRWEEVAAELARERLGQGVRLIVLGADRELMAEVLSTGLPHADALRASSRDGRLRLEPLDFKWSLETASVKQVAAETLARLLESRLPRLDDELARARAALGLAPDAEPEPIGGRFLAPEHPSNRSALRDDPGLPSALFPVDAGAFFRPLPGWPAAVELARMEGRDLADVRQVDALERYYRLGAGVTGALTRLRTGLFEETPRTVDAGAEVARMRRSAPGFAVNGLLLELEGQLAARKALDERLALLPRTGYAFTHLRTDLARAGTPRSVLESRGALGRLYGEVTRAVAAAIREAGRQLVAEGTSAEEALDRLSAEQERWAALAGEHARAIAARVSERPGARRFATR